MNCYQGTMYFYENHHFLKRVKTVSDIKEAMSDQDHASGINYEALFIVIKTMPRLYYLGR